MMSDHWKLLANLLGTPGPVDPNPSGTTAKPAAPTASASAPAPAAPATSAPARDPLTAMTEKEPDRLVPGFEIPPAPAAPEKPARRSAWDTLIGTLGIKVSEEAEAVAASTPPPAERKSSVADSPAAPSSRSFRSSSFGAGLADDIDDEPRAKSIDEAAPAAAKPKAGPIWRDEEPLAPTRRHSVDSSSKPKRSGFADGLIDWDPLGEDDSFDSDSDDISAEAGEFTVEKDAGTERGDEDRPRRRGRRGRGRNRGRDRDDRDSRNESREDGFVSEDDLSDSRADFDLDDERSDVSARNEADRDDIARDATDRGESSRGDSRRRGRRGERQRMGERGTSERGTGERAPSERSSSDRTAADRPASDRDSASRRQRERGPSDRTAEPRGPVDRSRHSPGVARSDFDFDDDLDLDEVADGEDRTVPTARTEREPGDRPRRRRGRRGRGGAGREGVNRESDRAESSSSHGFREPDGDFDDEPPFAPELAVDELEPVNSLDDDHEDHEDVEQMRRGRRRRRGGRGRGGDRSSERQSEESATTDAPRSEDAFVAPARQRNVPTWLDTVNLLVDANIERHRRSGGGSRSNNHRGPRR